MKDKNYNKAFSEVRFILKNTEEELINKIPKSFKTFIEENYDPDYKVPEINVNKKLDKQGLLEETIVILALIYRNYWCDETEREQYDEIIKKNEIKLQREIREKYNPDNIFKSNIKEDIDSENGKVLEVQQSLAIHQKSIWKRIWIKIKNIFMYLS